MRLHFFLFKVDMLREKTFSLNSHFSAFKEPFTSKTYLILMRLICVQICFSQIHFCSRRFSALHLQNPSSLWDCSGCCSWLYLLVYPLNCAFWLVFDHSKCFTFGLWIHHFTLAFTHRITQLYRNKPNAHLYSKGAGMLGTVIEVMTFISLQRPKHICNIAFGESR